MTRLPPTPNTVKRLFALSGNECAFPTCGVRLVQESGVIVGQVCHIEAAETGGPRFNDEQTDEERRDFKNLLVLCANHHLVTDSAEFTVEILKAMKRSHEDRFQTNQYSPPKEVVTKVVETIVRQYASNGVDAAFSVGVFNLLQAVYRDALITIDADAPHPMRLHFGRRWSGLDHPDEAMNADLTVTLERGERYCYSVDPEDHERDDGDLSELHYLMARGRPRSTRQQRFLIFDRSQLHYARTWNPGFTLTDCRIRLGSINLEEQSIIVCTSGWDGIISIPTPHNESVRRGYFFSRNPFLDPAIHAWYGDIANKMNETQHSNARHLSRRSESVRMEDYWQRYSTSRVFEK